MYGSGTTTLIISNEDLDDMTKIAVKALEDSLLKGVTKTLQCNIYKGGFLSVLTTVLGVLGSSLITNLLSGKGMYRRGQEMNRAGYD